MLDEYRREALRYWEKRRILFNILLFPAGWFGWGISASLTYHIDEQDPAEFSDPTVVGGILFMLFGANVCYSLVYVVEFFLMSEKEKSFWPSPGRVLLLLAGCTIGMVLAAQNMGALQAMVADPSMGGFRFP